MRSKDFSGKRFLVGQSYVYMISTKSISGDIGEIKNFLSDNRELVGSTEMKYEGFHKKAFSGNRWISLE